MEKNLRDKDNLTLDEFLASYDPNKWPKPSLTADIAIFAKNKADEYQILLIKRGNHPYIGCAALPGGFANPDENLMGTAKRELLEETKINNARLIEMGVYSEPGRDPRDWTVSQLFGAVVDKDKVDVEAGDDAKDAAWYTIKRKDDGIWLESEVESIKLSKENLAFDHEKMIKEAMNKFNIMLKES